MKHKTSESKIMNSNLFQVLRIFYFILFYLLIFFFFFFWFGFYGPSRLFHSFWAGSIQRWGENGTPPRKTTWPPTRKENLACLTCDSSLYSCIRNREAGWSVNTFWNKIFLKKFFFRQFVFFLKIEYGFIFRIHFSFNLCIWSCWFQMFGFPQAGLVFVA